MALNPVDNIHAFQIHAGTEGRRAGHNFEDLLANSINELPYPINTLSTPTHKKHIYTGNPAQLLLHYISQRLNIREIVYARAVATGKLATSETAYEILEINGVSVRKSKSDLIIEITSSNGEYHAVGVSVKQCNTARPTNAQLYFTTAQGFARLLQNNNIFISNDAMTALRQFCGDTGFQPSPVGRLIDHRRYFWEEILSRGKYELESIFNTHQDLISLLLFQKAYSGESFPPTFLLHKTKRVENINQTEVALFAISELITLSRLYQQFTTKPYSVRKGAFRDPIGVTHLAPRFGVIQMQRGGQRQHPEQLQFNLGAGYFYKLQELCNMQP